MTLRIAVIGGGIGELTAAVALLQAGFEVDVCEQAPELTEVGGGINMAPNATRVLRRLGLARGSTTRECARPGPISGAGRTGARCSVRPSIRCARNSTARHT